MIMSILLLNKNSRDVKRITFFRVYPKTSHPAQDVKILHELYFQDSKLCYNGTYGETRRLLSMNSHSGRPLSCGIFWNFSMVPCAVLCFLPVSGPAPHKTAEYFSHRYPSRSSGLSPEALVCTRLQGSRLLDPAVLLSCLRYSSIGSVISPSGSRVQYP